MAVIGKFVFDVDFFETGEVDDGAGGNRRTAGKSEEAACEESEQRAEPVPVLRGKDTHEGTDAAMGGGCKADGGMGARAVELLLAQLQRNELGVPVWPTTTTVPARRVEKPTVREEK